MKVVTGVLTEVPLGGKDGTTAYYLEQDNEEFLTIRLRTGQCPTFNQRIALALDSVEDDKECWTIHGTNFFRVLAS